MSSLATAALAFVCIFGSALLGMVLRANLVALALRAAPRALVLVDPAAASSLRRD